MVSSDEQTLFKNAADKIRQYNQLCLHYDLLAQAVYLELRKSRAPFSPRYELHLIAALISFDMGRMMGKGLSQRYDVQAGGFATRLHKKLTEVQPLLMPIINSSLIEVEVEKHKSDIISAYDNFADGGKGGLNAQENDFHVGTTKILHFLNPELFAIIDGNTAKTLSQVCGIPYRNTTQPGYSSKFYTQSLSVIKGLIGAYGTDQFRALENGTPIMRIFDKIAFVHKAFAT